jgi:dihydrofolate reductase
MIWAQARHGVIGANGALPWHLPEDLAMFRRLTLDSTVVMGRATWESLPSAVRPLPRRRNVVLTRDLNWSAEGAETEHSASQVVERHPGAWVIGGASVYAALMPYAGRVICTFIDLTVDGDTYAPELGDEWKCVIRDPGDGWSTSRNGLRYAVCDFARAGAS